MPSPLHEDASGLFGVLKQAFRMNSYGSQKADDAILPYREPTPRERMERARVVARRALGYWKGASLLFILASIVSLVVALNMKRIYRSECVVLVRPAMKTDDREESPQDRAMKLAPKLKDTLLTRTRLEPIIREFNLYPSKVETKGMIDAVEEMRLHIGFRGRDSETFVISFEDEEPDRTRAVTQKLAESTMDEFRKGNLSSSKQQAEFLGAEEKRAEEALETANRQLATFLAAHPEFAAETRQGAFGAAPGVSAAPGMVPPPTAPGIVAAQHSVDPQLASLYRQKARLETELRGRAAQASGLPVNDSVQNLTKARDDAARRAAQSQADLADKLTRFTDQHPDVTAARTQVDAAGRALQAAEANLDTARKGSSAPVDGQQVAPDVQRRIEDVQRQIGARQAELKSRKAAPADPANAADTAKAPPSAAAEPMNPLVAMETDWQRLLRATSDAKASHDDLARRMERASLRASATEATGDAQMEIIDPAYKPTRPARGGRTNAALVGLGLATFLAVGFAFARVATNDTLMDAHDVEALHMIPVLGVVPRLPPPPSGPSGSHPSSSPSTPAHDPHSGSDPAGGGNAC
jgi:capsular polysaccharide biosynthesis protein